MANVRNTPAPQPAARARALMRTPEEWLKRAVELAWKDHTIGTLRYLRTDENGSHIYWAQSRSIPEMPHTVIINPTRLHLGCDCIASVYGSPCAHIGAAWHALQQMVAETIKKNMANQLQYEWWSYYRESGEMDAV